MPSTSAPTVTPRSVTARCSYRSRGGNSVPNALSGPFTFELTTSAPFEAVGDNNKLDKELAVEHRRQQVELVGIFLEQKVPTEKGSGKRLSGLCPAKTSKSKHSVARIRNRRRSAQGKTVFVSE